MTSTPVSVEFTVPLVPVEPMVSGVDYYVYSWRIEYQSISTADCIFHSPQSLHLVPIPAPIYLKFLAGALTGGVGSVIGNPFHVPKTLSQANQGKAVPLMTLVSTMHAEQGMAGFYRGVTANIMCACVLNAIKIVCDNISKGCVCNAMGRAGKDVRTTFCSATLAGFFMTCTVSPFGRIRTALMSQPTVMPNCITALAFWTAAPKLLRKMASDPCGQDLSQFGGDSR
jgi:hypothetical protein